MKKEKKEKIKKGMMEVRKKDENKKKIKKGGRGREREEKRKSNEITLKI